MVRLAVPAKGAASLSGTGRGPAADIGINVPLFARALERHGPDKSKDGAPIEWPVELSKAPLDSSVAIRVAPVEAVLVVEVNKPRQRIGRLSGPLQHVFAPEHPGDVMHHTSDDELTLGGIPEFIVR